MPRLHPFIALDDHDDTGTGTTTTTPPPADPPADQKPDADGGELSKLRNEMQGLRKRAKDAEAEAERLRAAQMTEQEKTIARAEEAEKRLQKATDTIRAVSLRAEVAAQAARLGVSRSDAAVRLIDAGQVVFDEDGTADPRSVEAALKAAVKEYPFLTRTGDADAGAGSRGGTGKTDLGTRINQGLRAAKGRG